MKDVTMNIGTAWDGIEPPLIHKYFEKLVVPEDYLNQYNETYHKDDQWPGINFRGFTDLSISEADKVKKIKDIVDSLNKKQQYVSIDSESVKEAIEYNPNVDIDPADLIQEGFYSQRVADGIVGDDDNDTGINIHDKAEEAMISLADMSIMFCPQDFDSKEQA